MSIYEFSALKTDKTMQSLSDYKGKVILIVNSATHCGFTPHYEDLKNLYNQYNEKGLEILDFPCNQFGEQAQGNDEEIGEFCVLNYNTPYKLFSKIEVNGENQTPLFKYLKEQKGFEGFNGSDKARNEAMDKMFRDKDPDYDKNSDIKWNFTKFLINKQGEVVARFEPVIDMSTVEKEVVSLL